MKTRYELIIYWSKDDESFVVKVPELPGCMAARVSSIGRSRSASSIQSFQKLPWR
jgi:hypothetical protein